MPAMPAISAPASPGAAEPVSGCVHTTSDLALEPALYPFIYLASQSPRRQELLAQMGVRFELLLAGPDEDAEALEHELPGETPDQYVVRVTRAKADAAARRLAAVLAKNGGEPAPILVADTTVALGPTIFGKPRDARDAEHMLRRLAGQSHRVLTAIAVVPARCAAHTAPDGQGPHPAARPAAESPHAKRAACDDAVHHASGAELLTALSISTVRFADPGAAALARYAASGEPLGKAGAYGIQGRAAEFVEHIEGSYSGIMGLPLFETAALLRSARVAF
jgi:septum formation protein